MTNLEFHDAPPQSSRTPTRIDWAAVKESLKANPGKWTKVAENMSTSNVTQIRSGHNASFRGEDLSDFAFVSRRPANTEYESGYSDLWGAYKPEPDTIAPRRQRKRTAEPADPTIPEG